MASPATTRKFLISGIARALRAAPPEQLEGERRAVVACILRETPLGDLGANRGDVDSDASGVQVFFILRAARRGSSNRWTGQVGFPGGMAEEGETDDQTATRECLEEVGLHLDRPGAYQFLGEVRQRRVGGGGGSASDASSTGSKQPSGLVVCCRVYQQLIAEGAGPLQEDEVAACGWTPLQALTSDQYLCKLDWSTMYGGASSSSSGESSHSFATSTYWDDFPAVALPFAPGDLLVSKLLRGGGGGGGGGGGEGAVVTTITEAEAEARRRFRLWGLTLGIVNDFLACCNLRDSPIDRQAIDKAAAGRTAAGKVGQATAKL